MTATMTIFREAVIASLEETFASEGLVVHDDKIHESLGNEGPVAGVFPVRQGKDDRQGIYSRYVIGVQLFAQYDRQIDPEQTVSPKLIEEWVERVERAMDVDSNVSDPNAYYWVVTDIQYPDDPTGNKTRATFTLTGFGPNQSLAPGPP